MLVYETNHEGPHFHIPITLKGHNRSKEVVAMVDSGASTTFIHRRFVKENNIETIALRRARDVYNVDGTINKAGRITAAAPYKTNYKEELENKGYFLVEEVYFTKEDINLLVESEYKEEDQVNLVSMINIGNAHCSIY